MGQFITSEHTPIHAWAVAPQASPTVTLDVPNEVLIGDPFRFTVTFSGGTVGYGPFIDLILPAGGTDYDDAGGPCDGIIFVSAQMVKVKGSFPLKAYPVKAPCSHPFKPVCATLSHPYDANGVGTTQVPQAAQLVTIELPFGGFQPNQPPIVVQVTAKLSTFADANVPLNIYARGGFRFGLDEHNNPGNPDFDKPILSTGGDTDCTTWTASASVTPVLYTFKVEDPLSSTPGPCYDGLDNGKDALTDSDDSDCKNGKAYVGPENETATGPNYPRRYKIIMDIAIGQTITNLDVQDCLPPNVVFLSLISATPTPAFTPPPKTPLNPPNNCLAFHYSNITGGPQTTDIVIVFEFYIPDKDANGDSILPSSTCLSATSRNEVKASGTWAPLDKRDVESSFISDPNDTVGHSLIDKRLALQKHVTVKNPNGPVPDDVLRYSLQFQISDYFTFGNLAVEDFLSDGQQFLTGPAPTLTVTDRFGTSSGSFNKSNLLATPDANACCNTAGTDCQSTDADCKVKGGTVLRFDISAALSGFASKPRHNLGILTGGAAFAATSTIPATGEIVFFAKIQDTFTYTHSGDKFVDKHDPMRNCAIITGEIFTNTKKGTPVGTDVQCCDYSKTEISIAAGILKKEILCVNGFKIAPGTVPKVGANDTLTFRITMNFPSGDAENLTFTDWLPQPVLQVSELTSGPLKPGTEDCPKPGSIVLGPKNTMSSPGVVQTKPADNSFTISFGSPKNPYNKPVVVDILFTVTVSSAPFADGLLMTNEVKECEQNSFDETFCQVAVARFELTEPQLTITKGVVWTDNSKGKFTPKKPEPPQPPPPVTFLGTTPPPPPPCPRFTLKPSIINSSNLAAIFINSDLSDVDEDDLVTYAIIVENRGTGVHGAFHVKIYDTNLPPELTLVSPICVTYGDGSPIGAPPTLGDPSLFDPGGLQLNDYPGKGALDPFDNTPGSNGHNIAVITFHAQIKHGVSPVCLKDTGKILHYAASEDGTDFVSAGFGGYFTDDAWVCVLPTAEKCVNTTSEAHTVPDNSVSVPPQVITPQVAIGEIVRYRLKVVLPEGESKAFVLKDTLPQGLEFLPGTATVMFVSDVVAAITSPFGAGPVVLGHDATCLSPSPSFALPSEKVTWSPPNLSFDLGPLVNSDKNDSDQEFVVVDFNVLVQNIKSNQNGVVLENTFEVLVPGQHPPVTSPKVRVQIVEPNIAVTKSVSVDNSVPGKPPTANYKITYTNNGTATAFDVLMTDALPAGQTIIGTVLIDSSPPGCTAPTLLSSQIAGNVLTVPDPKPPQPQPPLQMPIGCTVTVTFKATVDQSVPCKPNEVKVTYTSLPGPNGTPNGKPENATGSSTPGATGDNNGERPYSSTAQAPLSITCCAEPPPTLSAWWPFDETSGSVVHDIRSGNDGTPQPSGKLGPPVSDGPSTIGGVVNNAHLFTKYTAIEANYHKVADSSWLNFGSGNLSIDAWFLMPLVGPVPSQPTPIQPIVDKFSPTLNSGYALYTENKQLKLVLGNGLFKVTYPCSKLLTPFVWTHIAVAVDRVNGGKFYINGAQAGPAFTPLLGNITNNVELWIGKSRLGDSSGEFRIDELEIFQDAISLEDVEKIFKAKNIGKCKPKADVPCDLVISKTHSPDPLKAGQQAVYTITVKNLGTTSCGHITVTDDLPKSPPLLPGVTFLSWSGADWNCSIGPLNSACTKKTSLAAGATSTIKLTIKVGKVLLPGFTFKNCVDLKAPGDSNQMNNHTCDEARVVP